MVHRHLDRHLAAEYEKAADEVTWLAVFSHQFISVIEGFPLPLVKCVIRFP